MTSYTIRKMAEKVAELTGCQFEKVQAALEEYWRYKIALIWTVEDVLTVCPSLSDHESQCVLSRVFMEYSSDQGLNWDIIAETARKMYGKRALHLDEEEEPQALPF